MGAASAEGGLRHEGPGDPRHRSAENPARVPDDLAACHTAEIAGYLVEGHVPAAALWRLLAEKPTAAGLAVPGMPIGSPGMEGGSPEPYQVVLFGPDGRRTYARFLGDRET
jgi:hypothetical protein